MHTELLQDHDSFISILILDQFFFDPDQLCDAQQTVDDVEEREGGGVGRLRLLEYGEQLLHEEVVPERPDVAGGVVGVGDQLVEVLEEGPLQLLWGRVPQLQVAQDVPEGGGVGCQISLPEKLRSPKCPF